jgi:hypothetical protein
MIETGELIVEKTVGASHDGMAYSQQRALKQLGSNPVAYHGSSECC